MKKRYFVYSSTIIVLGIIQATPLLAVLTSTIIGIMLGIIWMCALWYFWSSTKIGSWYFRELWKSTEFMERELLGCNADAE